MRKFLAASAALFIGIASVIGITSSASAAQNETYTGTLCGAKLDQIQINRASAPPQYADYLGVYGGGAWNVGNRCNALIVSNVDAAGRATVYYIFGPTQNIPTGYFIKKDAQIKADGTLNFTSVFGATITYGRPAGGSYTNATFSPQDGETLRLTTPLTRVIPQQASR